MDILYVEDTPQDADLTRRFLAAEAPQIKLDIVETQHDAETRLSMKKYDLVLADLKLPQGDGLSLLADIRARCLPVAVVIITGSGDEESVIAALRAGADDYVIKREDYLSRLSQTLETALNNYQDKAIRKSQPIRVLYGEHNSADVDLTQRHLKKAAPHIQLNVARIGPAVLKRIDHDQDAFDVLLLDYRLSGMDALEVLKELRLAQINIPVVLTTGHGDEDVALQALKMGAYDYIVKSEGYLNRLPTVLENAFYQARLAEEEERFRLAMDATVEGLWDWDIPTGSAYFSPGFFRLIGYEMRELPTTAKAWHELIHPDDQQRSQQVDRGCIENRSPNIEVEYRIKTKEGDWKWVLARGMAVGRDEQGQALRIVGTLQDLDERKRIEQMMVESEKLAGIGTLSAGIAHEINTPLQVITGISDSLKRRQQGAEPPDSVELIEKLETISRNAWRIAEIVRSLLDYSHSSTSQTAKAQINEIVQQTLLLLEHQFSTWANITISKELGDNLPDVDCDINKITQVLINLLTNARDAMPDGGQIEIKTHSDAENQNIIISVSDNGEGIPDDIKTKVFDPFFTTKPVGSGTGLGLSISQSILRAHGGRLELVSSSKEGSIFTLILPAQH